MPRYQGHPSGLRRVTEPAGGRVRVAAVGLCRAASSALRRPVGRFGFSGGIVAVAVAFVAFLPGSAMAATMPPTISTSFGAASIPRNGSTSLSFAIGNPNFGTGLAGIGFTDDLPAGLVVATPNGQSGDCGGTVSAAAGSSSVSLSGGSLPAGSQCTISVNVTGTWGGEKNNSVRVSGGSGLIGNTSTAAVTVTVAARERVYWTNDNAISYINLDGSGGGNVTTTTPVYQPQGVALDPAAGKVYWANYGTDRISYANLDGSGGGDLDTSGGAFSVPVLPALLEAPRGIGAPALSGGVAPGSHLSCSSGLWADSSASKLYQAPQTLAFQWSKDGADIPGATSASFTASAVGAYRCTETATNFAGSASQTSGSSIAVFSIGKPKLNKKKGTATLPVDVPGAGTLTLTGKGIAKQRMGRLSGPVAKTVTKAGKVNLTVRPKGKTKKKLKKKGKAKVKLTIGFTPTGGTAGTQAKSVTLKQR